MAKHASHDPERIPWNRYVRFLAVKSWIGYLMFIIGAACFGLIAFNVIQHGPLTFYDQPVATDLHNMALQNGNMILQFFVFGSFIGREGAILVALALCLYFFYLRQWREFVMVSLGPLGSEGLFELFSGLIHRHRPVFAHPVDTVLPGPGFPSGHTMMAIVLYGLILYLFWPTIKNRTWRALFTALILFIMVYIGFSRIYLGDHWLTDVIAGYFLGIAWFGLFYTTVELVFRKPAEEGYPRLGGGQPLFLPAEERSGRRG
jgi:undecaprenyl-diphosphatase